MAPKISKKSFLRFNALAALFLALVGVTVNVWLLGHLFAPLVKNGTMVPETRMLIWIFQAFCIISAILVYFKGNTPQQRKRLVFGYIMALLMVFSIEVILHLFNLVLKLDGRGPKRDYRLSLPSYRDKEWAEEVFKENSEFTGQFEQYLGFARKNYHGQHINVDHEGARKTWNPPDSDPPRSKKVFMFGGSTMFGWGVRDDYTIASHVSRILNEGEQEYLVSNYGQDGYMFMQEVMKLILLIREGKCPDYAIFYDGTNDVYGAYQSGKVGSYQNIMRMEAKLKQKDPTPVQHLVLAVKNSLIDHSMIYRALKKLSSHLAGEPEFKEPGARYDPERLHALAEDITDHYARSMDLLARLSEAYGFRYVCFWQPVTYTEKHLLPEESGPDFDPRTRDKNLSLLYRTSTGLLDEKALSNFYNIGDVLYGRTEQVYSDACHLSERGNEMVAERIVDILRDNFLTPQEEASK